MRIHEIHMLAKYEVCTWIISKVMSNVIVGHKQTDRTITLCTRLYIWGHTKASVGIFSTLNSCMECHIILCLKLSTLVVDILLLIWAKQCLDPDYDTHYTLIKCTLTTVLINHFKKLLQTVTTSQQAHIAFPPSRVFQ